MTHENERKAFERGAEAMRQACMCEFNLNAAILRQQLSNAPREAWGISQDLRLRAEIADHEYAAELISKLPVPEFTEL